MVVSFAPNFLKYRPHRVNINSLRSRVSSLCPPSNKISVLRPTLSFLRTFHYVSTVWRKKIRAWVSLDKTETIYPNKQLNKM